MTESDWNSCADPQRMLGFLRGAGKASGRKCHLFAAACCRLAWAWLGDERSRRGVEIAERWADGWASEDELEEASVEAYGAFEPLSNEPFPGSGVRPEAPPQLRLAYAAACLSFGRSFECAEVITEGTNPGERQRQVGLLRCLFGDLYYLTPPLGPSLLAWQDGLIPRLAQSAYQERSLPSGLLDPARLSILADALEDAGCQDEILLSHLRNGRVHVRGCWAVDHVLNRG